MVASAPDIGLTVWTSSSGEITIGNHLIWDALQFNGMINELRIYGRALSSDEIAVLLRIFRIVPLAWFAPALLAHHRVTALRRGTRLLCGGPGGAG